MSDAEFTMTISGQAAKGHDLFDVLNPATETICGRAPNCTPEQLDQAVRAARDAYLPWRALPYAERQRLVAAIGATLGAHLDALKPLLTSEQGKPQDEATWDILGGAHICQGVSILTLPIDINEDSPEHYSETRRVPIGVVGAIAPWNVPIALAMLKVAPALLAGNTVILKPSPFTPLTTLKIGELLRDVLPPGVLNVISGDDRLGPLVTAHPGIDKISFTGSTQTGRKVMASAAQTLKRVTLELGGNDPAIVLPDVNVAEIAEHLFWAAFRNNGQICVAAKRVYVHTDVYDSLKAALSAYTRTVKIGDGAEQGTQIGPLQNKAHFDRLRQLIADARENGYVFLTGDEAVPSPGYFLPITILDNPPEDSRIVQEEQFGPVLPLLRVDTIEEAIERANASEYGLGASIWSKDIEAARKVAERLDAGIIWINDSHYLSPLAAFSGHKQSGIGVENGLTGLIEFTNAQTFSIRKPILA